MSENDKWPAGPPQQRSARAEARLRDRDAREAAYARDLVDAAPPLTAEQRDRLVVLFRTPSAT